MNAIKLYEIVADYKAVEALESSDDLPEQVIRDTLEGLTGDLQVKATNICKFVRNIEASADVIDDAAKAMQARANRLRKRAESVKAYLLFNLQATGINKIEAPEFVIAVRNNPESVKILENAQIPAEYLVTPEPPPPRPDKTAIKAALKAGKHIDGCYLEAGQRLEIKV
jgi:hypothetical protein